MLSTPKHFWPKVLVGSTLLVSSLLPAAAGTLVKSGNDLYWIGADGQRFLFAGQDQALASWSLDASKAVDESPASLATHPFGGVMRFKPGTLAGVQTSNQLYLVTDQDALRPLSNAQAAAMFPKTDAPKIAVAQFANYTLDDATGSPSLDDTATTTVTPDDFTAVQVERPVTGLAEKTFVGKLMLTITNGAGGLPIASATVTGANSPDQSLTVTLVNQSNEIIKTCAGAATCSQAIVGDYANNAHEVIARATNELGETIFSAAVPVPQS